MAIPTLITELSTTAAANSPAGSDSPSTLDDIQRAHASFIAQLRDRDSAFALTLLDDANAAAARTTLGAAASGANTDITSLGNIASINGGQLAGLRSLVINGSFGVWQRGTSFILSSSGTYTADRWIGAAAGANLSATRGAGFSNQYAFAITGAAGNTFAFLKHRIESANAYSLANRTVTVSGRVFNNSASIVPCSLALGFATAADNFLSVTGIETKSTPLAANSWTLVSFTTTNPLPAGVTAGLEISINLTSGLPDGTSIAISDTQLEVGSVATPFEHRPYGMELALCQRYYEVVRVSAGQYNASAGNTCAVSVPFKVTKRAAPSVSTVTAVISSNVSSATYDNISVEGARYVITASAAGVNAALVDAASVIEL